MTSKARIIVLIVVLVICIGVILYEAITKGKEITENMPRFIIMILTAVILVMRILSNSTPAPQNKNKTTVQEEVASYKLWIEEALESSGYKADYTIDGLKEIDRFITEEGKEGGLISQNLGEILFGLSVYVGETIIKNCGGEWCFDDSADGSDLRIKLLDGSYITPLDRVVSMYKFGNENSIHAYGYILNKRLAEKKSQRINEIWKLSEPSEFIIELSYYLSQKCEYGAQIGKLNQAQKVLYVTYELEAEVNNGGFSQYFYNPSGNLSNELVPSFKAIGAERTAEICQKAVSIFGDSVPVDRNEREECYDKMEDDVSELLSECDHEFYEYEDNIMDLQYKFVMENKDSFMN